MTLLALTISVPCHPDRCADGCGIFRARSRGRNDRDLMLDIDDGRCFGLISSIDSVMINLYTVSSEKRLLR